MYRIWQVDALAPQTSSVNLALNQSTWQSSTLGTNFSRAAVDGNRETVLANGFCSSTNLDSSPWLAVDLGKPTDVYGAAVTNANSFPG
jgi:N-formylglutamate amidohydrolase